MTYEEIIKQTRKGKWPRLILGWRNGVVKGDPDSILNLYDILRKTPDTGAIKIGVADKTPLGMVLLLTIPQAIKLVDEMNQYIEKEELVK